MSPYTLYIPASPMVQFNEVTVKWASLTGSSETSPPFISPASSSPRLLHVGPPEQRSIYQKQYHQKKQRNDHFDSTQSLRCASLHMPTWPKVKNAG